MAKLCKDGQKCKNGGGIHLPEEYRSHWVSKSQVLETKNHIGSPVFSFYWLIIEANCTLGKKNPSESSIHPGLVSLDQIAERNKTVELYLLLTVEANQ